MDEYEFNKRFLELTQPLELEHEQAKRDAFIAYPRPIPEGLISPRPSPGHIAFQGDFDRTTPNEPDPNDD